MKKIFTLILCLLVGLLISCAKEPTVDDVVNKIADACGGADKLASITDQVSTWDFTMHMMPPPPPEGVEMPEMKMPEGGPMIMPMIITAKKPNKLRMDFQSPDGKTEMSSCFNGTSGWAMEWGQKRDLSEAEIQEWENMASTWIDGFMNYQDKGLTLELLPKDTVDSQEYMVLQATDKHGNVQKYFINPTTNYIERQVGEMMNMQGEKETMTMTMKDYKMVDGVALATHIEQFNQNGDMIWEATLKEAKNNTGVEDSAFMPAAMSAK